MEIHETSCKVPAMYIFILKARREATRTKAAFSKESMVGWDEMRPQRGPSSPQTKQKVMNWLLPCSRILFPFLFSKKKFSFSAISRLSSLLCLDTVKYLAFSGLFLLGFFFRFHYYLQRKNGKHPFENNGFKGPSFDVRSTLLKEIGSG